MTKRLLLASVALAGAGVAAFFVTKSAHDEVAPPPAAVASPAQLPDIPGLMAKAEKGDAEAEFLLGMAYGTGRGVTNNYTEAATWYRRAADQGHAGAQASLGELYEAGQGVSKDLNEALKLYRTAAEHGNANAQYTLGFLYEAGRGVPQDQAQAAKWYELAAEKGQAIAQYDLGQRYDLGVGVPVDRIEALKWLMLAAANGQKDAATRLITFKKSLSRAEISEAKRRVAVFSNRGPQSQK